MIVVNNNINEFEKYKRMPVWRENGFELYECTDDYDKALAALQKSGCAFMLIFNKPPVLEASRIIKLISYKVRETEAIVISPYDNTENMRECFLAGAVDYLCEPVSETRIKEALLRAKKQYEKSEESREYRLAAKEYFEGLPHESRDDKFISNLFDFILKSEGVTVTTETAADYFGFNKDYFGRMFKARLGITFGDFYKHFRILYAQKLLRSGRYKVYEVSEQLGFSSVDYFTSVFKKVTGKRPSELKKF